MSTHAVKLPDVGEGVAEAELVAWRVQVGEQVTTESVLAEVMTDKATVEISSPVAGQVVSLHGEPGEVLAVGGDLAVIELSGEAPATAAAAAPAAPEPAVPAAPEPGPAAPPAPAPASAPAPRSTARVSAAPAVRERAQQLGIDLATVTGSGPEGRVLHADLDRLLLVRSGAGGRSAPSIDSGATHAEPVRGLRRRIAQRLTSAWREIPHITYVDGVDATELESLRAELNRRAGEGRPRLTMLPFVVRAIALACHDQPRLNAHYDATAQTLTVSDAVHVGIATQTPDGLVVPVLRHAEARSLRDLATEIGRLADTAKQGRATSAELSGSTITITSLGALGGTMTTPIINQPEVAIVGVNKLDTRPVWRDGAFVPRQVCNLSCSFDHRIVDGWDAAVFVQRIKTLLEVPALLFVDDAG